MGACTLHIGPRRVLVADGGPPAAEFALFDAGDIELAQSEPGVVREAGYRTTVTEALRRLAVAGVTLDVAEECASIVRGRVAEAYARGPLVRRLSPMLSAAELFEGATYDATLRRYEGGWLDLPLLANDAQIASATGSMQAMSLVALLSETSSDALVVLSTLGYTESLRLGERTLRKQAIDGVGQMARALRHLAEHPQAPQLTAQGPTRESVEAIVKERLTHCIAGPGREHLLRLGRALTERIRPANGPLNDPELWAIDRQLAAGEGRAALERIEAREMNRGREPATIYLRARASLMLGRETPRVIAQRVGELALSMSDFHELELLAAQAWDAAGETRLAIPFARDLVGNPRVHDELRAAAELVLRGPRVPLEASMGAGDFEASAGGDMSRISHRSPPSGPPRAERAPQSTRPIAWSDRPPDTPRSHSSDANPASSPAATSVPPPGATSRLARSDPPPGRGSEPPTPRTLTPPERAAASIARDGRRFLTPPERIASPLPPREGASVPPARPSIPPMSKPPASRPPVSRPLSTPPPSNPPARAKEVPTDPPPRASERPSLSSRLAGPRVSPEGWPASLRAPREERVRPEEIEHTPMASTVSRAPAQRYMRGASMPPQATEPPPRIPRAPVVPRVDIDEPELIETLPAPRGAGDSPLDPHVIPRTPLEARIRFTLDSHELARRYRREHGLELRLEPRTIAAMQRHLAERFVARVVSTPEEAREAELHGALLSEILARMLDAEWVDIAPTELGYWGMVVPQKGAESKRVWPFGRVLRFIASGGEDDLVAFFRKLREMA